MTTPILSYRAGSGPGIVRVDLNKLDASRMLVQANSGGGKSRAIRQLLDSIKYTGDARRRILAQTNNRGGSGIVECPKCGGRLHYGQASTNKHIHAHCDTAKCLSWME